MSAVMKFFGMKPAQFRSEWQELDETSKEQLKTGVSSGTFTY
jgi:hypothetical protein